MWPEESLLANLRNYGFMQGSHAKGLWYVYPVLTEALLALAAGRKGQEPRLEGMGQLTHGREAL